MTNPNDPAFASAAKVLSGISEYQGLTKREYFAATAMQGICCSHAFGLYPHEYANLAVKLADALIAELNKEASI